MSIFKIAVCSQLVKFIAVEEFNLLFYYPNSFIKLDQIDDILHLEDYFQQLLNPTSCGDQNILLIKLIGSSGFELNGIFILALLIWNWIGNKRKFLININHTQNNGIVDMDKKCKISCFRNLWNFIFDPFANTNNFNSCKSSRQLAHKI